MIVSIDIGTSYSSICILGPDKKAVPVDISTGASMYGSKYSLPSAVFVDENGKVLVGQAAMNSRKRLPQNFRMEFKRDLGQDIPVMLGTRKFLPRDFYTEMFRHMTECAKKTSGEQIEKAYITYPASYGKKKREQIEDAAKKAGLFEIELVDEPTAAAMCYCDDGYVKEGDKFLIYDFGGGTFDVCAVKYEGGKFSIVGEPDGIENCGGIDIDRLIYQDMLSKLDKDTLEMVNQKPINRMRLDSQLAELAIKAKHHLSSADSFNEDIQIGFDLVPYKLDRTYLDSMMSTLISQTIETCRNVLKEAGLKTQDLSAILMVGGTSRIPLVQSLVKQFAGSVPVQSSVDLELAVSYGAIGFFSKYKNTEGKRTKLIFFNDNIVAIIKNGSLNCLSYPYNKFKSEISKWKDVTDVACVGITRKKILGLKKDGTISLFKEKSLYFDGIEFFIDKSRKVSEISSFDDKRIAILYRDGTVLDLIGVSKSGLMPIFTLFSSSMTWMGIIAISCGASHTAGLKRDGTVLAVGDNKQGQCNVSNWTNIVSIACGTSHTVGLKNDGTVLAVGDNKQGQCNVSNWTNIVSIACGNSHTVALKNDGTVLSVGDNEYGQCNTSEWHNITSIFSNGKLTAGIQNNRKILLTGYNSKNQQVFFDACNCL